ncbi:hypothetical protein PGTUg99_035784 [Puccinia graminis f. sp. tritici]|uniref:Uncharacterized protein n=1 Tax=Puccinia graminis f. sp. tritici TaxID=56615 RepID=A0A5B0S2Q3_PUCGR|nr:hypothetical protein PGTUg99_035784 [Puccinia graminis f. sp. tritici]
MSRAVRSCRFADVGEPPERVLDPFAITLKVSLIDAVLQENGGMGEDAFPRPPSAGRNAGNVLPLRTRRVISLNVNLSGDLSTQVFMYRPNR